MGRIDSIFIRNLEESIVGNMCFWLVVWNMNGLFSPIVGMMIQSDELIFFRGVGQPPISLDVDNYIPSGNLT
jgi:hypothetical protein